jgi:hypothetical protein
VQVLVFTCTLCTHTHTHTHTHMKTLAHINTLVCVHTCKSTHTHSGTLTCTHTHRHSSTQKHMDTQKKHTHTKTNTHLCILTHMHTHTARMQTLTHIPQQRQGLTCPPWLWPHHWHQHLWGPIPSPMLHLPSTLLVVHQAGLGGHWGQQVQWQDQVCHDTGEVLNLTVASGSSVLYLQYNSVNFMLVFLYAGVFVHVHLITLHSLQDWISLRLVVW